MFFHLEQTYWIDILCNIQSYETYKENLYNKKEFHSI